MEQVTAIGWSNDVYMFKQWEMSRCIVYINFISNQISTSTLNEGEFILWWKSPPLLRTLNILKAITKARVK